MRAATVLGIEPNALWKQIIPMQVVGIFYCTWNKHLSGEISKKKRGAGTSSAEKDRVWRN